MSNSGTEDLDNGKTPRLLLHKESCYEEVTEESNGSEDRRVGIGADHQSDSDSNDSLGEDEAENKPVKNRVKGRRDISSKDLDIDDLFNTNMFQKKKILEMSKVLHTMKDAISFVEDNSDPEIDSRGVCLSRVDKMRNREKFKKDLAEKNKHLDQLFFVCYEEGDGHVSSGAGTGDYDIDDDYTNKSLKRMITDFQTLMGRKNVTKDNFTNIKVRDVQVADLQYLMALQSLALQK